MVEKSKLPIVWDKEAVKQLKKTYEKILEDSYSGAVKVRNGIIDAVEQIPEQPYRHPAYKFKKTTPEITEPLNCIIIGLPTI